MARVTKTNTPAPAAPVAPAPPVAPVAPPVSTPAPAAAVPAAGPRAYVPPFQVPPPPSSQESRNGVQKPGPNTSTGYVWDVCDFITKEKAATGQPIATRNEVVQACAVAGTNVSTAMTQYGKWARFYGYTKPAAAAMAAAAAVAVPAPAPAAPGAAPVPAPGAPVNPAYQAGYDGYKAALTGQQVSNPYTEGSPDAAAFGEGWQKAHEDTQAGN